ncbi:MAG: DNA recombination protein RmuC [Endomicrobiales bacterium]|nr:DNA recombination protein RmuC [Endomicrobiales bacterium]
MSFETIIVLLVVVAASAAVVWALKKQPQRQESLLLVQQQMDSLRAQLAESLKNNTETVNKQLVSIIEQVNSQLGSMSVQMGQSQKNVGERLDSAARAFADVQKGIGSLAEASQRILEVGKDISGLQEILSAPKTRGGFGELLLGDLLAQVLPKEHFSLQAKFKSGETVDAVIKLESGLVPVDAKFPLENFKRTIETENEEDKKAFKKKFVSDVKKHIDAISSKYILPDEGTFDFALMYIPAENVYYEIIAKDDFSVGEQDIAAYALLKKVVPVSPNSFYAYLRAIALGLKGMKIEKGAKEIIQHLARLRIDLEKFKGDFEVLGKHITSSKAKYDEALKRFENFESKLASSHDRDARESIPDKIDKLLT